MIASIGASAVLLFTVPHGALSQPWPLIAGHLTSALIGVTCFKLFADTFLAESLSVALAIAAMHYLRCIHPPGGATALTAVLGGDSIHSLGYYYAITPILINIIVILIVAIFVNNLFPWRRYPLSLANHFSKKPSETSSETELVPLSHNDLEYALKEINSFIDVTEDDLAKIYRLATQHHLQANSLQIHQVQLGHYYSNGLYNKQWAIRQVISETDTAEIIIYKVIAGHHRRKVDQCTRAEFAQWAKYEVFRNESSWQRVETK
jgi:CBS-domain-containing membrane protein